MTMDRRQFLGSVAGAACVAPHLFGPDEPIQLGRIGVQLYTLRAEMAKNAEATLAKVAALGYREVEFAGYFDQTPEAVRMMLGRNGLIAPATHIDYASVASRLPQVIAASQTIGHKYIVMPWLDDAVRKQADVWKRVADTLNRAGEMTAKAGIRMAYHNHHFEFVPGAGGRMPFDELLEQCDSKLVTFEIDLAWMVAGGQDPLAYFARHPGRFPLVHVKGLKKKPAQGAATPIEQVIPDIADVGGDLIDWGKILPAGQKAGVQHFFVEHDQAASPFDSLKASFQFLQTLKM
jgi:sugar phosphate isomerase/epimerase